MPLQVSYYNTLLIAAMLFFFSSIQLPHFARLLLDALQLTSCIIYYKMVQFRPQSLKAAVPRQFTMGELSLLQ